MNSKDSNNVHSALDVIRRISSDSNAKEQLEILQQLVSASHAIIQTTRKLSNQTPKAKKASSKIKPKANLILPSERNKPSTTPPSPTYYQQASDETDEPAKSNQTSYSAKGVGTGAQTDSESSIAS